MVATQGNRFNFLIVFLVALGSWQVGYTINVVGSILGMPSFFEYFDLDLEGSSDIIGAITGCFFGGGIVGASIAAYMSDAIGRRLSILIICMIGIVGGILQGAAVNVGMILAGRALSGISCGGFQVLCPVYQSEIAPPSQRGRMVGAHGFMNVTGASFSIWLGLGSSFDKNPQVQWRLPLAFSTAAPLFLACLLFLLPESPRWLVTRDRHEAALEVLKKLHQSRDDPQSVLAQEEYIQIRRQLDLEKINSKSFLGLLKDKRILKRLFIGAFIQFVILSTGVLVVLNYQVILYGNLGIEGWLAILLLGVYTTWGAILNFVNSLLVDHMGRVKMILIGVAGCIFSLIGLVIMLALFTNSTNKVGSGFGIFFIFLFTTFFDLFLDVTLYVYCAEIFPTYMRTTGMAVSIIAFFATALIYGQSGPTAFATIGWKYYLIFIIVPFLGLFVIWKMAPETKNLSLEEISGLFGGEVALDITRLTAEERNTLDAQIVAHGVTAMTDPEKLSAVHAEEADQPEHESHFKAM